MAKAGAARVWNTQVARDPAAEMTGVRSDHPRLRQQGIHCLAQRTRIYKAGSGNVVISGVVIAAITHTLRGPLASPPRWRPLGATIKFNAHGLRCDMGISKHGNIRRRV